MKVIANKRDYLRICKEVLLNIDIILSRGEGYVDAACALHRLAHELSKDGFDDDFMIFTAIVSDTDHLPLNNVRDKCSKEYLKKSDVELLKIMTFYQVDVEASCRKLIDRFSN